jgi:lysozyme family protein
LYDERKEEIMGKISFSENLAKEYERLYRSIVYDESRFSEIDALADTLLEHRERYENVAETLGIPWYFVGVIHNMESSMRFDRHLHNGDPLNDRTIHVPAGRPKTGNPPFSWEESAIDALKLRRVDRVREWSLGRTLYEIEGYNGWGYRLYHKHVLSPYLWSWSGHYCCGKYIYDGTWSDTAKSKQCGAAVLLRRLEERGEISPLSHTVEREPYFFYSDKLEEGVERLQSFLNTFAGIALRVDGNPGPKTSAAVKKLFGNYLKGDPRGE